MEYRDEIERVSRVYKTQYKPDPKDRKYLWNARNRVSVYYRQAQERALVSLLNKIDLDLEPLQILDVGCGVGGTLRFFASIGARPGNLHGIDLMDYRIAEARLLSPPTFKYFVGNAVNLAFPDQTFHLTSQFTVFSSILEPGLRHSIANEMDRVLKPAGHLLWYDLCRGSSGTTRGIILDEIRALFPNYEIRAMIRLHPFRAASLVKRSFFLTDIVEHLPFIPKTHLFCLLNKPAGQQ